MGTLTNVNILSVGGMPQSAGDWTMYLRAIPSPNTAISAPTAVGVGVAAVRLDSGLPGRRYILIVNNGNGAIYVGGSASVTTTNGIPLPAGASLALNLGASLALYGIGAATQDVRVMEVS